MAHFSYRLDTNFAKIDRIELKSLEEFKSHVLSTTFIDRTIQEWIRAIRLSDTDALKKLIDPDAPIPIE